jgi:Mg2+ and Co2+ transporter CorA
MQQSQKKRLKMERVVTDLARQKAEKAIPKDINQQINAVKTEILQLAEAADDSAARFASAINNYLANGWPSQKNSALRLFCHQ